MKYRKKPVVIEAIQWTGRNVDEILSFMGKAAHDIYGLENGTYSLHISTLEGDLKASPGDYIIKGVHGEFYPCKPDVFEETYELEESLMIDMADYYKNKLYIRDANESEGHLCNSLNAEGGSCFRMAAACGKDGSYTLHKNQLEALGYYLERAQGVIWYLREEIKRLKEENKMTNFSEVRKFLDEVPTDIAGRITEEFFGWPKGTKKDDIEKWFDKKTRGEDTRIRADMNNDVLIKVIDRYS